MSAIAVTLATRSTEALLPVARDAWSALARLVRHRVESDRRAATVLAAAQSGPPDDADAVRRLAVELDRLATTDPAFGAALRELWQQWQRVRLEFAPDRGSVVNSVSGVVGGSLLQARDLTIHRPDA